MLIRLGITSIGLGLHIYRLGKSYPFPSQFIKGFQTKNKIFSDYTGQTGQTGRPLSLSNLAVNTLQIIEDVDVWSYIWGSPFFSTSKAYAHLTGHHIFRWLWKSSCQNKHKVFFWLLLHNRLSTREILRWWHMILPTYECVCCHLRMEETLSHLFFDCPFALAYWSKLNIMIIGNSTWQILEAVKEQINLPFFMEIIVTFYWSLWMQRNDFIFRGIHPSPQRCLQSFKKNFALVILRERTRH